VRAAAVPLRGAEPCPVSDGPVDPEDPDPEPPGNDGSGTVDDGSDGTGKEGAGSDGAGTEGAGIDGTGTDGTGSDGSGTDGSGAGVTLGTGEAGSWARAGAATMIASTTAMPIRGVRKLLSRLVGTTKRPCAKPHFTRSSRCA